MTKRGLKAWAGLLLMGSAGMVGIAGVLSGSELRAQALPTATQSSDLSVFAAGTGTYTQLDGGRNAGISAGVDLMIRSYFGFRPGLEVRGTYPLKSGDVVGLKSVLIGPKIAKSFGRYTPYVDGFFGRGAMTYQNGGIIINNFRYDRTTTNIYGVGVGLDYRLTRHFDVKADAQFQRWSTPVVPEGKIYPIPISFGLAYHFDFNGYGRHSKGPKAAKADKKNSKLPQYN